mgnify:CR=1 FL=1
MFIKSLWDVLFFVCVQHLSKNVKTQVKSTCNKTQNKRSYMLFRFGVYKNNVLCDYIVFNDDVFSWSPEYIHLILYIVLLTLYIVHHKAVRTAYTDLSLMVYFCYDTTNSKNKEIKLAFNDRRKISSNGLRILFF